MLQIKYADSENETRLPLLMTYREIASIPKVQALGTRNTLNTRSSGFWKSQYVHLLFMSREMSETTNKTNVFSGPANKSCKKRIYTRHVSKKRASRPPLL